MIFFQKRVAPLACGCLLVLALPACAAGVELSASQPVSQSASQAVSPLTSRERVEDICTQAPRSEWLPEAEMRLLAEFRGYKIVKFKIANRSCYEIYGFKDGQIVEAYFNPVTSKLVRQNTAK